MGNLDNKVLDAHSTPRYADIILDNLTLDPW